MATLPFDTVTTEAELNQDLAAIALTSGNYTITLGSGFTLNTDLLAVNLAPGGSLTLQGNNQTIDGGGTYRGLFDYAGVLIVNDLTIANARASGGSGGSAPTNGGGAGGGGAGLGGGLFVAAAGNATLNNVTFNNDSAVGGAGGHIGGSSTTASGGGGGMGGNGGNARQVRDGNGGYDPEDGSGGGIGVGAAGGSLSPGGPGLIPTGATTRIGGGGGTGSGQNYFPGNGGVAAQNFFGGGGSNGGGFGGGGGGGSNGGFGGGGGGTSNGGFGAGNGGTQRNSAPTSQGAGGGGLGAGGDIFVQQGGQLTLGAVALNPGTVAGGGAGSQAGGAGAIAATGGGAYGNGIFIQGNQAITFAPPSGTTTTVSSVIADMNGSVANSGGVGSVIVSGAGTLKFAVAESYTGGTSIRSGTLELVVPGGAGTGAIAFNGAATLRIDGTVAPTNTITAFGTADTVIFAGIPYANGATASIVNNKLTVTSGGQTMTLNVTAPNATLNVAAAAGGTAVRLAIPTVTTEAQLNALFAQLAGSTTGNIITIGASFTLNTDLNLINLGAGGSLTINGGNFTIDGADKFRGLTVYSGTVAVNNLALNNLTARGGAGGNATNPGGGGAGLGGGLLVASGGNVTLTGVTFSGDKAIGGNGGDYVSRGYSAGGGGGLGGHGGNGFRQSDGGGGGFGTTGDGGQNGRNNGRGYAGSAVGGASGGAGGQGTQGGINGGGGGDLGRNGAGGGGSGGQNGNVPNGNNYPFAGNGGWGGGGGGGGSGPSGAAGFNTSGGGGGGFGGGAGGYANASRSGGFGGGGGGGGNVKGAPGFGGGLGGGPGGNGRQYGGGGGGLGAGGDILVQEGGTLTIGAGSLAAGTVRGGTGGTGTGGANGSSGGAFGNGLFLQGNQTTTLAPLAGTTLTIAGVIADQNGSNADGGGAGSLVESGGGIVNLLAVNTYTGGTLLNGGTLELAHAKSAGSGAITFGAPGPVETLRLDYVNAGTTVVNHTILSLAGGPTSFIYLPNVSAASGLSNVTYVQNKLTFFSVKDGSTYTFNNLGVGAGYRIDSTSVVADASGTGVDIFATVTCFAEGTRLRTAGGEIAVEALAEGDLIATREGAGEAVRPIVWIGRRHIDVAAHPNPAAVQPIRIRRDAVAQGVPARDLLVSPDHAIHLDGALIPARLLVNGASITQETEARSVRYFHVELAEHAILFAEGLEAESYLDTGNRAMFENAGVAMMLHPDFSLAARLSSSVAATCVPLAVDAAVVQPVWTRLAERAAALGHAAPPAPATTRDPALRLRAGGRELRPVVADGDRLVFALPPGVREAHLVSRAARPSELEPWRDDRRLLGVAVGGIMVHQGASVLAIAPDHPGLTEGWWGAEREGCDAWRWTSGAARLALPEGATLLEVRLAATTEYRIGSCPHDAELRAA